MTSARATDICALKASVNASACSLPTVFEAPTFSHTVSGVKRRSIESRMSLIVGPHSEKNARTSSTADVPLCCCDMLILSFDRPDYDNLVPARSEEHTSELQSLMRISYAVFCLKKK